MIARALPILVLSAIVIAGTVTAQTCVYAPDNQTTGGSNVIPFGHQSTSNTTWSNQKYQTLIPTSTLGNVPGRICEMAFVPMTSGTRQFKTIKVQLAQTTLTTLTTTWATNLGANPTTVLDSHDYHWPNQQGQWNRIGFQNPFLYLPQMGNVVLDIEVTGAGMPDTTTAHAGFASVSWFRLYAFGWTGTPPPTGTASSSSGLRMELCFDTHDAGRFGIGCNGSNNMAPQLDYTGSAQIGSTLNINLSQAAAGRPVLMVIGFTSTPPFPIDLTALGAPMCWLYASPDFASAIVSDAQGAASTRLPIPNNPGLACARFYNQFIVVDPQANNLGLAFSNYGRALLGN